MPTPPSHDHDRLRQNVERQVRRMKRAEKERESVMGQAAYLSTLVMAIVLPTVAGAYLGRWIDGMRAGYSVRWTISLIFLGLVIGMINVYLITREKP